MDTFAVIYEALSAMVNEEFVPELIVAIPDELHEALASDGKYVGISLARMAPMPGATSAMNTFVTIQFFNQWDKAVNPLQAVDPRIISGYHDRLLRKIQTTQVEANNDFWFFQWDGTDFPRDPTGNKTRFVMSLRAWSDNAALVETR